MGYINPLGRELTRDRFDYAAPFSNGRALVGVVEAANAHHMKYGYIDLNGKLVIPLQFYKAESFSESKAAVANEYGNWGYVDKSGKRLIEPQFFQAGPFSDGLALVADQAGRYGFIDTTGAIRIELQFNGGTRFSESRAAVVSDANKVGYIDQTGHWKIPAIYEAGLPFSEGLTAVKEKGRWRYINPDGTPAFSQTFDQARSFRNGLAAVKLDKEWGFITPAGDWKIPPQFAAANPFDAALTRVVDGVYGRHQYVDRQGKIIRPFKGTPALAPANVSTTLLEAAGIGFGADGGGWELTDIKLESEPANAVVYLIPRRQWETIPELANNDQALAPFKFEGGNTPASGKVLQKVYYALFEYKGKRLPLKVDVFAGKANVYKIVFPAP
ncbi:MAG TPA: WG repeat-containing protein [Blastocatellia bacterium]|nr:WG repeat-containing protein [Blastocatellia bacterium]